MAIIVTESYRKLLKESLVASLQQIDFRVVELWKLHAVLLAVCLPHEPAPVKIQERLESCTQLPSYDLWLGR